MNFVLKMFSFLILTALISCGGGGDSATNSDDGDEYLTINGIVNKGIVLNADVNAYVDDEIVAQTVTNDQGRYSLSVSSTYSDSIIEIRAISKNLDTDGEYSEMVCDIPYYYDPDGLVDGAIIFGESFQLTPDFEMRSFVYTTPDTEMFASVTPITHLAVHRALALGGLSLSNLNQATGEIIEAFNLPDDIDILSYAPDITDESLLLQSSANELDYSITNSVFLKFSLTFGVNYMTLIDNIAQIFSENGSLGFGSLGDDMDINDFLHAKENLYNNLPITSDIQVFHYAFEELNSAQCRNNIGNFLHGNIFGAIRTEGVKGNALKFIGDSSFAISPVIDTPGIPLDHNRFYADTWIKLENESNLNGTIMGDTFGGVCSFHWYVEDGYLKLYVCDAGEVITSTQSLQAEHWYHLAVTYDGQWIRLFIDGDEDEARELLFNFSNVCNVIHIGDSLEGILDEVRLFSYDMSAQEVNDYYQQIISGAEAESIVVRPTSKIKNKVIHYTFDESESTTAINVAYTGAHDGEINMGLRDPGVIDQAVFFDTTEGYVKIPLCCSISDVDIDLPLDEFTIATWFNFDSSIDNGDHSLLGTGSSGTKSFDLEYNDGVIELSFYESHESTNYTAQFNVGFDHDTWFHLAIVYNSSSVVLYINGSEVARQPITYSLNRVVNNLYIGNDDYNGFIGGVDDFRFYDQALSDSEIIKLVEVAD